MAVVFARFSAHVTPVISIHEGDVWDAEDPLVLAHPEWFADTPAEVKTSNYSYTAETATRAKPNRRPSGVEDASADPGEKRSPVVKKPDDKATS